MRKEEKERLWLIEQRLLDIKVVRLRAEFEQMMRVKLDQGDFIGAERILDLGRWAEIGMVGEEIERRVRKLR